MATCIDDSNYKFRINNSMCKIIKLCRPNPIIDSSKNLKDDDHMWQKIQDEANGDIDEDHILAGYYDSTILSQKTLENALAANLSSKLSNLTLSSEILYEVFITVLKEEYELREAIRGDLNAWKERNPSCLSYVQCFLNFKGFLAIQAQRIAHKLWIQGRIVLAGLIQSRVSEVFAIDIHPGARIGKGIVLDQANGVVIGETSVIGNNVTILHNVTLGGTGKNVGDRHPKIGDGVFIGAGAKVLGNIRIGEGATVEAGSVVLKEVYSKETVVGNPAKPAIARDEARNLTI